MRFSGGFSRIAVLFKCFPRPSWAIIPLYKSNQIYKKKTRFSRSMRNNYKILLERNNCTSIERKIKSWIKACQYLTSRQ